MEQRLLEELALVREFFPDAKFNEVGRWFFVAAYPLPAGWDSESTDVAFQVNELHPAASPYGFYVPSGLRYAGEMPEDYTEPAQNSPPFAGTWGMFSWTPKTEWQARSPALKGSNLLDWIRSFRSRFEEGR